MLPSSARDKGGGCRQIYQNDERPSAGWSAPACRPRYADSLVTFSHFDSCDGRLTGGLIGRSSALRRTMGSMGTKMRGATVCTMAIATFIVTGVACAQNAPEAPAAACPGNPDALGVARTVEIDTTNGPGFGFAQFKAYDFLGEGEVVLTFDDGPWPGNTSAVLKALAAQCTKALFFAIGKHAIWHPEILKQVAAAGHTIGSHTWQRFCVEHHGQLV
jgi:hypothetical protein